MKRFLLIPAVIFVLAFSLTGCGRSPGDQDKAPDKPVESVSRIEVSKIAPAEAPTKTMPATVKQPVVQQAKPVKTTDRPIGSDTVADVIEMKNTTAFNEHTRPIVMFGHKKHFSPAPDGYGLACGECHHDKNGQPLELKAGDFVQACIACHDKPEKPGRPPGMPPEEWQALQLEYYYGAVHANCIDCHKARDAGPTKCNECHPKPER